MQNCTQLQNISDVHGIVHLILGYRLGMCKPCTVQFTRFTSYYCPPYRQGARV